ncbi:MAG: cobyrinate a,c-diamide synthase, partial [Proteobacteria bacterium]|nr:cobyrinate a,c-diamide synthase [Pseudomonadota bacterium]
DTLLQAMAATLPGLRVLGCVPRHAALALPERHLGLVQAREHGHLDTLLDRAADAVAPAIDCAGLRALARPAARTFADETAVPIPPLGQRIAVACDDAFAFAYPALLDGWRAAGAELSQFSPLADAAPGSDSDAVYLPGGYPELHAGRLAGNTTLLAGLRGAASRGATIYGECGGYMVLGRGLVDAEGRRHAMAGLLPLESSFAWHKLHLGYRRVALAAAGPLGTPGAAYRGHEFHYASVVDEGGGDALFSAVDASGRPLGPVGRRAGRVMGSFVHLIDRAERPA